MSYQNVSEAKAIVNVNVAYSTAGGWGHDDGKLVSKDFADKIRLPLGKDEEPLDESMLDQDLLGEILQDDNLTEEEKQTQIDILRTTRPFMRGDKLSDFNGNKGIAATIIDPDMPDEEAEEQGLLWAVKFFRNNRSVDIIEPPHSILSRSNAGILRRGLDSVEEDLEQEAEIGRVSRFSVLRNAEENGGKEVGRAIVKNVPYMVTAQDVVSKTKLYEGPGEGRKVSGQVTWVLTSSGATGIMHYFFSNNVRPWQDLREYMILFGLDISKDGDLLPEYTPRTGEENYNLENFGQDEDREEF